MRISPLASFLLRAWRSRSHQESILDESVLKLRAENEIYALYVFAAVAGVGAGLVLLSLPGVIFLPALVFFSAGLGWVVGAGVPVQLVLSGRIKEVPSASITWIAQCLGSLVGVALGLSVWLVH